MLASIKKNIEELVESEYRLYGFEGRAEVNVHSEENIIIYISHEEPYMGEKFFKFLETLQDKLGTDYTRKDGKFFYSYYIMEYAKKM